MSSFINTSDWIKERSTGNKKSGSVLISLFCDVVDPHGGQIALGSLITACKLLGISEQAVRSSVNRLLADGWLESETLGRQSIYRFSGAGSTQFKAVYQRIYQRSNDAWCGQWQIVVADRAVLDDSAFTRFSQNLTWTGFGKIAENIFVRPNVCKNEISGDTANECELDLSNARSAVCFRATVPPCLPTEPLHAMVRRAWAMDIIEARYKNFIQCYEPLLATIWQSPGIAHQDAFTIRTFLIHDCRRIRVIDPQLPAALLPEGWCGHRALYIAHELYDLLMPTSERYIMDHLEGPHGKLPHVDIHFYDRFGGLTRQ